MSTPDRKALKFLSLFLLRVVTGLIFLNHGAQKLFGTAGGVDAQGTAAHLASPLWFAGTVELLGAILVTVGLYTRPTAFILAGEMALIYYRHHAHGVLPVLTGGAEVAILCCFILFFLCTAEEGPWSLDRVIRKKI